MERSKLGIDVLLDRAEELLGNGNCVLITGSSNVDSRGLPVYQLLKNTLGKRLKAIWSLQHGFMIDKQDNMVLSDSFYFEPWDLEIRSLYGERLLPADEWLEGVDTIIVDVFDVGTRVYTFINHVLMVMNHLSGKGIEFLVLDRPNPLGGLVCEGNVASPDYFSIVGQVPVPMRHGLTAAEFLRFGQNYYKPDISWKTVELEGFDRGHRFTGIWTYPSPNMPSLQTAVVYPGAVLLEGTNLSEGRGTTRPFEFVGAPFVNAAELIGRLADSGLRGVTFIPVYFKPEFSKFAGEICEGLLVHVEDFIQFRSFAVYYEIIRLIRRLHPSQFEWKEPPYEFEHERPPIDMINGSDSIRTALEEDVPFQQLEESLRQQILAFRNAAENAFLY